jgi:hypothetical protein
MILAFAFVMAFPLGLAAQDDAAEERDLLELNLYGGLSVPTGGIKDFGDTLGTKVGLNGGVDFGVFIKSNVTLGFGFNYSQFEIDNENPTITHKHRVFSPNLFLRYYLPTSGDIAPYVHGRVGLDFPKFTTIVVDDGSPKQRDLSYSPAFAAGLGAGVFMYTSDYSGFFLEADYHQAFSDGSDKEFKGVTYKFNENYGLLDIRVGVHLLFGSGE